MILKRNLMKIFFAAAILLCSVAGVSLLCGGTNSAKAVSSSHECFSDITSYDYRTSGTLTMNFYITTSEPEPKTYFLISLPAQYRNFCIQSGTTGSHGTGNPIYVHKNYFCVHDVVKSIKEKYPNYDFGLDEFEYNFNYYGHKTESLYDSELYSFEEQSYNSSEDYIRFDNPENFTTDYINGFVGLPEETKEETIEYSMKLLDRILFNDVDVTAVELPDAPYKEGHTFKGWYYDETFETPYDGNPFVTDTQLYAKYEIDHHTVTFHPNGGIGSDETRDVEWGTVLSDFPEYKRTDYTLQSWSYDNGDKYEEQPITEDTHLYADWIQTTFTIQFTETGESTVPSVKVDLGQKIDPLPEPKLTGMVFRGWFDEDGEQYTDQPVTRDMTLHGEWEVQMVKVQLIVDGEVYREVEVPYGTTFLELAEYLEKQNYKIRMAYSNRAEILRSEYASTEITAPGYTVDATEMDILEKTKNILTTYKWWFIGGAAGFLVLVAVIATVSSSRKRKR